MLKYALIGVAVGAATVLVFILISAFALTVSDFDSSVATPLANICLAVGAAVGGIVAALLNKSKGLIIGAVVGFSMFIIVTVISLIVSGGDMTFNTPLRLVIMTLLGAVGGVIGVNRSAKHKLV